MINASNIITLCWLIFLGYWLINWRAVKPTKETAWQAPGFRWTLLWIIVLIIVISRFVFLKNTEHVLNTSVHAYALQPLGILITMLGLIIAIVARKTLADNWSSDVVLKKDHELITKGIYHYVRHPIYTGMTLMGIGSVIVLQTIIVALFFIVMVVFLVFKMKKEETLMLKHFPKEYPAYRKKTKALIPFIY